MSSTNGNTNKQLSVKIGDYVFASRWSDCNPNDPWAIGLVTSVIKDTNSRVYVTISDLDGILIPNVGNRMFRNTIPISYELGERLCEIMPGLEEALQPECGWQKFLEIP